MLIRWQICSVILLNQLRFFHYGPRNLFRPIKPFEVRLLTISYLFDRAYVSVGMLKHPMIPIPISMFSDVYMAKVGICICFIDVHGPISGT